MDLIKKKMMFTIASAAMGLSLVLTSFSFADNHTLNEEQTEVVSNENISEDVQLSSVTISQVETQELSAPQETSAFTNKFMVNISEYLNVRAAADENSEVVGKLYAGSGGDILERGPQWTKISSGNVVGYVNNQYVVFDEAAEALANQVCPWIASINTDTLRVRKEASADAGVWGLVAAGETYTVTGVYSGWVSINYDGNIGYLSLEYVSVAQQIGTGITTAEEQAAIKAEEERLAAIAAQEAKKKEEQATKVAKAKAASQFVETIQTSPYSVSEDDAYLLACLVAAEAGNEIYEGKLAVANVVLNRLNSGNYGNSISAVIYKSNQFTVASNGALDSKMASGPNAESVKATKEALSGVNNVPNYLNFCSESAANYSTYKAYTIIGNQVFYRK